MQLPYAEEARVPKRKLTAYLLDPQHEDAGGKAPYFIDRGFRAEAWELFAERLREHAVEHGATETEKRENGTTYIIRGPLRIPGGGYTQLPVRAVWMIDAGKEVPRFITAYPVSS